MDSLAKVARLRYQVSNFNLRLKKNGGNYSFIDARAGFPVKENLTLAQAESAVAELKKQREKEIVEMQIEHLNQHLRELLE